MRRIYSETNPARIDVVSVDNDPAKSRPLSHFLGTTALNFVMSDSKKTEGTSAKGQNKKKCLSEPGDISAAYGS